MNKIIRNGLLAGVLFALLGCVRTGVIKEPTSSPVEAARANFALGVEYF